MINTPFFWSCYSNRRLGNKNRQKQQKRLLFRSEIEVNQNIYGYKIYILGLGLRRKRKTSTKTTREASEIEGNHNSYGDKYTLLDHRWIKATTHSFEGCAESRAASALQSQGWPTVAASSSFPWWTQPLLIKEEEALGQGEHCAFRSPRRSLPASHPTLFATTYSHPCNHTTTTNEITGQHKHSKNLHTDWTEGETHVVMTSECCNNEPAVRILNRAHYCGPTVTVVTRRYY